LPATKGKKSVFYLLLFSGLVLFGILILQPIQVIQFQQYISVLFPKGIIGIDERNLLLIIQGLMLVVIIPVYVLTFIFSWRYRAAQNAKAVYDPDLVDNKMAEVIWWGLPLVMTLLVGWLTWVKTYDLDPYKTLGKPEKKIQVVALQWKWLFIYPEENIATINFLQIPKNVPIHFEITADAPMNSFWIPSLGGQIYAMPNMRSELHLIANEEGDFRGSSANISGEGFARMHFNVRASSEEDFEEWVISAKESEEVLDYKEYRKVAAPSMNNPEKIFALKDEKLFNQILMQHMHPSE
jgi:cytochrome o ubiquinol oxidase subunit 2